MSDIKLDQVIQPADPADKAAMKQMSRARALMMAQSAFFTSLTLSTPTWQTRDIPTAGTDGRNIVYNPDWMKNLPNDEVIFILAHEVMHIVLRHVSDGRIGSRNPMKWNIAGDYVINWILSESGIGKRPDGALFDEKFADMTTEQVYDLLPDMPQKPQSGGGSGGDKGDSGGGSIPGTGRDLLPQGSLGDRDANGKQKTDASGNPQRGSDGQLDSEIKQKVAAATQEARRSKEWGNLPANLKRMVGELLEPAVSWRQLLRRWFTEFAKDDYSWKKRSKRHRVIMPGMWSEHMGTIAIVIDVSGSIDDETFRKFLTEVQALRDEVLPLKTIVMNCDTRVSGVREFEPMDSILDYEMTGGGGTDMPAALAYINDHIPDDPQVCLVFTDMFTPFAEDPGFPVMWAALGTDIEAPYGETIRID